MSATVAVVVTASVAAVLGGGVVHLLDQRHTRRADQARRRAEVARDQLRGQLDTLNRLFVGAGPGLLQRGTETDDADGDELATDAFDPVSGLLRETFIAVLIRQRVAAARRRLHPVAVVALEADCACRAGDVVVIAALDDTTEEGARLAIGRIQSGLRLATGDVGLTVSAGIACYPTHALEAPDLVVGAGQALLDARSAGTSRVATAAGPGEPSIA